jgi:dynein heavy chain
MAKLDSANKLVDGLAGENTRWTANVKYLKANKKACIGDSLLAAAFVSYIGAFSAKLRRELW